MFAALFSVCVSFHFISDSLSFLLQTQCPWTSFNVNTYKSSQRTSECKEIVKLFERNSNERMFMQKRINLNKTTSHTTNMFRWQTKSIWNDKLFLDICNERMYSRTRTLRVFGFVWIWIRANGREREKKYYLQIIKITILQKKTHKFRWFANVKGIFIPLLLLLISIPVLLEHWTSDIAYIDCDSIQLQKRRRGREKQHVISHTKCQSEWWEKKQSKWGLRRCAYRSLCS